MTPAPVIPDPWLTDVTIPAVAILITLVAAGASVFVAVAALKASQRATDIAVQTRADALTDARRAERLEFVRTAEEWIETRKTMVTTGAMPYRYPHELKRAAWMLEDSAKAMEIADWIGDAMSWISGQGPPGSPLRETLHQVLIDTFMDRAPLWVNDPLHFHLLPFEERALH